MIFRDRIEAGQKLAQALKMYRGGDTVVYALPRGGVVTANEVARTLDAPLDLIIARKIGHPMQTEYAIAAVAEDGSTVTNPEVEPLDRRWFEQQVVAQQQEARRRRSLYLSGREPVDAEGKVAIVVDDGLATGLTMLAAIEQLRNRRPRRIVVAAPVGPPETVRKLKLLADEVVVLYSPETFVAVGGYYLEFDQVSDAEVVSLLNARTAA